MPVLIPMEGKRFGAVTVLDRDENDKRGHPRWRCRCDCGTVFTTWGASLRKGHTASCGCRWTPKPGTPGVLQHGQARDRTRLYRIWAGMWARCKYPGATGYKYYGGRGITVCERWRDFATFAADMGEPPTDKHTLDRRDGNGNYDPDNCRWATRGQQQKNLRPRKKGAAPGEVGGSQDLITPESER
jgi:hypothetical protein